MKNIFSKISSFVTIFVMMVTFAGFSTVVSAQSVGPEESWNPGWKVAYDCPTLSVANQNTNAGTTTDRNNCWFMREISASVGDVVQYTIFFHNSTGSTASNVRVDMNDPQTKTGRVSVGANVYANGQRVASDAAHITIPSGARLRYVSSKIGFPYNTSRNNDNIGTAVFSGGYTVGSLASTDADQGYIKVKFVVEGQTNPVDNSTVPSVNTNRADVSGSTVTLNGNYSTGGSNTTTWFQYYYGSECAGAFATTDNVSRGTNSGNGTHILNNVPNGTYSYRMMARNDKGTATGNCVSFSINNSIPNPNPGPSYCSNGATNPSICNICPSGMSLNSNNICVTNNNNNNTYIAPTAQTLSPVTIDAYQTTLGGYYTTGSCAGSTWFEYGPTQSLGSRTNNISRSAFSAGNTSQTIYGLSANTTYYYRVISQNCQQTATASEIRSFTTSRPTIIDNITRRITPRVVNNTTVNETSTAAVKTTVTAGTGVKYLRLNIDNSRKEMSRGENITYEVQWENISNTVTLNDLVLEVTMPKELQIVSSSRGDIDRSANAVYLNIDRLDPREEGRMTVTTRMNSSLRDGDPVVGRAIMAFENPTLEGAQENAIAYDSDRYLATNSTLGASAFGAGFLPGTLAGWLIIFLIIVLIILAARHYMRSGYYPDDRDHGGPYTPYRPQA